MKSDVAFVTDPVKTSQTFVDIRQDNMIVGKLYHSTLECMNNFCFCASTYFQD